MKIIYVEWEDAACYTRYSLTKVDCLKWGAKTQLMVTVGFLIDETQKYLLVGATYSEREENFKCLFRIPKGWIKKRKYL